MKYEIDERDLVNVMNVIGEAIHPSIKHNIITGLIVKLRQLKEIKEEDAGSEDTSNLSD